MAIIYNNTNKRNIYYQMSTTNQSFLNMHYFLKDSGRINNKFMLQLLDPDLAGINPHDNRLNSFMKQKILRECIANYWYFLREVVRIPDQGNIGQGAKFELHRGNLALNYCLMYDLNIFYDAPRQVGFKSVSSLCRYLWILNFGTSNSEIVFLNKKMDDSKLNLQRLKDIRDALPTFLQMDQQYARDGKKIKAPNTVETLQHPLNGNKIRTVPSARNKVAAASLLRGRTIPIIWADEYAFIPYNNIIYTNTVPAFKTAALNAKRNHAPYGMLITTTPGMLTTDEGLEAYNLKEGATRFNEMWYDMSYPELMELISTNTNSSFVYIRYTYQQLGRDENWFREICIEMRKDWASIRREILLEWSASSENCPFTKEDLEIVKTLLRQPIRTILLLNKYEFNIYEQISPRFPPLIGVDVSGGYKRDSSAITVVDSQTTRVTADMNCNYISTIDLAKVIYELVTKYMNNAVVNIERNGGYGASVLSKLVNTSIKRNLYFEIKDKVIEERFAGANIVRKTQKTKIYGLDSTKVIRELLIQILRERMEYHKDKFVSPIIYQELEGLEVKKDGRVEHSSNSHDDQIFSYLMALYIWYEGKNLMETYGIQKSTIKTDQDLEEAVLTIDEKYSDIIQELETIDNDDIQSQVDELNSTKTIMYEDWMKSEHEKDQQALAKILMTKVGKETYAKQFNINITDVGTPVYSIPSSVFDNFYDDTDFDE